MLKITIKRACMLGLMSLLSWSAHAQLAGKNVILVHGLQTSQLMREQVTDAQVEQEGADYWNEFWNQYADDRLDWSSKSRLGGDTAVRAYNKVIEWAQTGFCREGCIFVTHSTGDLVVRYLLDKQDVWTQAAGLPELNVLAVLDFAGAGGGSELADLAIDVADGGSLLEWSVSKAVSAYLGFDVTPSTLGVLEDLRPTVARQTATAPSSVPRLRFVGGGTEYFGLTGGFLPGTDDGVVALHSACGGNAIAKVDSCVNYRALDGKASSVRAPSGLWHNHYPVLMGKKTHHGGTVRQQTGVELAYVNANFNAAGVSLALDTQSRTSGWWLWKNTYHTVKNSAGRSMSQVLVSSIR